MNSKILKALLSLVVAFGLWLYVVTVVSPEFEDTYSDINNVSLRGEGYLEDRNLVVINAKELPAVTLRLQGKRSDLAKLNSSNISVKVDVSDIHEAGTYELDFELSYSADVSTTAFSIQYSNPSRVTVIVEDVIEKPVPVEAVPKGKPATGYKPDAAPVLEPITVTGPRSMIDKITKAVVEVDMQDRKEAVSELLKLTLYDNQNKPITVDDDFVQSSTKEIQVDWPILRTKQISFDVKVIPGGGATRDDLQITFAQPTVWLTGSEELIDQQSDIVVIGQIDLSKPLSAEPYAFELELAEGLIAEGLTGPIEVQVSFKTLAEKTVSVSEFAVNNAPEDHELAVITKNLSVLVRGPKETVESLDPDAITVTVDVSGVKPDTVTPVDALVSFEDQTGLTAIGSYQVSILLTQPQPLDGGEQE